MSICRLRNAGTSDRRWKQKIELCGHCTSIQMENQTAFGYNAQDAVYESAAGESLAPLHLPRARACGVYSPGSSMKIVRYCQVRFAQFALSEEEQTKSKAWKHF
jgi:hypothetical protein